MIGVTSQGSNRRKSAEVRIRQGQQRISQAGTGTGMQVTRYRGPGKTHTKAPTAGLAIP
ncbi:unnamed protein product [Staurois parvus]|uniref:Uncharacterized protein n=1 Tax=Staurois parvus TaxID=386267 RepID=A0ABN9HDY9_9NEOB|nr:unnamed protein product [Staurois parvus]